MAELTVRIEPGDIVERVLDEMLYKGKTLREWADYIANPKTNADRIRGMSDEELANVLAYKADACWNCTTDSVETCVACWLEWLKSPVVEE